MTQPEGDQPLAAIGDRQRAAYSNQPIFDAIAAATSIDKEPDGFSRIVIDAAKFVAVFNNHRDRALCTDIPLPVASAWQGIETAPRDGTKVDLLYPYPRGRQKDCQWREGDVYGDGGWFWSEPRWDEKMNLLPESKWNTGCYLNMQPTHWMLPPLPPGASSPLPVEGERETLADRISIYVVEGDEQFVHFATHGEIIARVPVSSAKGIALLKLDAVRRALSRKAST